VAELLALVGHLRGDGSAVTGDDRVGQRQTYVLQPLEEAAWADLGVDAEEDGAGEAVG
jgi:hypothetical protein